MTPELGALFDGRYRLDALEGEGGMGRVYRAFDITLRRRVGLKLLHAGPGREGGDRTAAVLREARAAAALDHPGVVAVFDVGEVDGRAYIVMEYVVGRSLREYVADSATPIIERLGWLRAVADSLSAAHRAGLVHRDIKPENVMVRADGAVKLLDFGIARQIAEVMPAGGDMSLGSVGRATSRAAGTPSYMAPEQVQRRPVDARADQFSWGVLAYELLAGVLPWKGPSEGVPVSVAVVTERQEPLSTKALGLDPVVGAVIDRALEKSPQRRFGSMQALLEALGDPPVREVRAGSTETSPELAPGRASAQATLQATAKDGDHEAGETTRSPAPVVKPRRLVGVGGLVVPALGLVVVSLIAVAGLSDDADPSASSKPSVEGALGAPPPVVAWSPGEPARAAFEEGQRRLLNGALNAASSKFAEAVEFEPEFAAAHLRLAFVTMLDGPYPAPREPFYAASRLRRNLSAQDRGVLDALSTVLGRQAPDPEAMLGQLGELARAAPEDVELELLRTLTLLWHADDAAAADLVALTERQPPSASPWLGLAYLYSRGGDKGRALAALDRCVEVAEDAIDCVWLRMHIDATSGRCEAMAEGASRWRSLAPGDHGASTAYIYALIGQGRSDGEIDAAIDAAASMMSITRHAFAVRTIRASQAVLRGDFAGAEGSLRRLQAEVELTSPERVELGELRVLLREEMGDLPGAAAVARDLLLRKGDLPGSGYAVEDGILEDPTPVLNGVLAAAGEITRDELGRRHELWSESWRSQGPADRSPELWLRGAGRVRTPEEAREALVALDALDGAPQTLDFRLLNVDLGRALLLGGRPREAVVLLREATRSCIAAYDPLRFVQGHALLGEALEELGEVDAACSAYGEVRSRWGDAQPGSTTAAEVRARMAALGCPKNDDEFPSAGP